MLQVGITGNIGSGKTLASRLFQLLGVPVYLADEESKKLLAEDEQIIEKVKTLLGDKAYHTTGLPDRQYIAGVVFNDKQKLKALENILHPAVKDHYRLWAKKQDAPYLLKEAALLFESGSYSDLDKIILIAAPEDIRIQRVCARDKTSAENVLKRIQNQWEEGKKAALSDYVIHNNGKEAVIPQVLHIHKQLLVLSRQSEG